jgi:hypothetical protein
MSFTQKYPLLLVVFAIFIFGCSEDPATNTGNLKVLLTDAPFPTGIVSAVNVTVYRVAIHSEENMNSSSDLQILSEKQYPVNILALTNGIYIPIADLDIDSGAYDYVQFYFKDVHIVLTDGRIFPVAVPDIYQNGMRIELASPLQVKNGMKSELLLDFDIERSFSPIGGTTLETLSGFEFNPHIRGVDRSQTGNLFGKVEHEDIGLLGAQITVYQGYSKITSTFTDPSGNFAMMGLPEGLYDVYAKKEGYASEHVHEIMVKAQLDVRQDFMLSY